jgi:hypothetical protein
LSLCAKYDIIWRQQAEFDKVGSFLKDAINRFDARYGSLSFFDDRYEDIKIENGYGRSRIDRHISIAAHVLYSSDVLVILDTKQVCVTTSCSKKILMLILQDWRFENNPLVLAKPKIRFFAGAPLISTEGEVVGVLAIFGKEPRTAFTPQQRKELAEFSSEIVKELDSMADTLSDPKWRTTPLLERDSVINGMYARRDFNSPPRPFSAEKAQSNIIPSALHYHMSKSSTSSKSSRHYFGSKNNFGRDAEPTPPPSAESNYNSFFDNPQSFGKNHEQLCEDPVMNDNSVLEHQTTLSRQYLRVSTPRPFSSSDITSLNIHPPNTPDRSLNDEDLSHQPRFDLTFENFLSLSDADCAEEPRVEQVWEDNLIDKVIRSQKEGNQQRHTPHNARFNANTSGTSLETSEVNAKAWNTPVKDSFAGHSIPDATSSPLIDLSNPPRERGNLMALAPFPSCPMDDLRSGVSTSSIETIKLDPAEECREFNEQHDFDLIYCVEIKPALPYFMTDQELLADNGLRKRVLIAYGLPFEHSDLNSRNHLEALRSEDCKRWNNPKMHYGEFDYATGYMVPVHAEGGPRGLRTAGIVLGVFRKERIYEAYRNTRHEKQLVMEFAQKLSRMLVKSPQPTIKRPQTEPVSPGHVQPQPIFKRSHTDPVAHSPFLANEAREVTLSEESGYGYSINARYLGAYPRNETLGTTFAIEHTPQYLTTTRHVCGYSPGQVGEAMFGNENTPQYPTNTHYVAAYQPGQAREAKFNDEHPLQYPRHFVTDLTNEAADGTSGAEPTYPMNLTQDPPKKARGGNRKLKKFVKNVGAQMVQTIGSGGYV